MYFVIDKDASLVEETIVTEITAPKREAVDDGGEDEHHEEEVDDDLEDEVPVNKTRRSARLVKEDDEPLDVV